jgi:hypothetical protein
VNVGLGTGNKDQQVQHLMALTAAQQQAYPAGIVTPKNIYQSHKKLAEALGYKQDGLFFSDPTDPEVQATMPKPGPNPELLKLQADHEYRSAELQQTLQLEQARMQMDVQKAQAEQEAQMAQTSAQQQNEAALAQHEAELKAQLEQQRMQHEAAMKQAEMEHRLYIEQLKVQADKEKAELEAAVRIQVAQISAQNAIDTASLTAQQSAAQEVTNELGGDEADEKPDPLAQLAQMHGELMGGVAGLISHLSKPKTIIRGPDGRAIGVQ